MNMIEAKIEEKLLEKGFGTLKCWKSWESNSILESLVSFEI